MRNIKILGMLVFFILAFGISAAAQVTVAGSTGANGAYTSLNTAFTAINGAGTQAGNNILVTISGNTTETASATLNASDWTTLTVRPTAAATVSGTIVGAIIKLNGADNVTIDGRIGGVGTSRDLSVVNNSTATATAAIWLASVIAGNGAANNVIRNLELAGGADQRASTSSTFGIIMCGTTISTTANGIDNDNNQFIFNRIIRTRYGIVTRGTTTDLNINPVVTDNIIGPAAFGADQIGRTGILMQADTGGTVSRNTVQNVGVLFADTAGGSDRVGIGIGSDSWSATDTTTITSTGYTVTKNIINNVVEEKTFSAVGLKLATTQSGGATNNLVANNFILNIRANATSGDQLAGIGIAGGNGDRVVFNSISLTGDQDPGASTASSTYGTGIRIPGANGTNNANFVVQNNSVYIDVNSNTAANHFYAITLNSATYSFGTGGLNFNNYYINPGNAQLRTGGVGVGTGNTPGTEFATLANWQAALTPAQDANSIQADPQYFSTTADLHIQTSSPNINVGTTIAGVTDDIDAQVRPNGAGPDIGADEFYTSPGSLQLSSSTYSVAETAGSIAVTVTRTGGANGAVSVNYTVGGGTATGGAACTAGVDYITPAPGTLNWADLDATPKFINVTVCADGVFEPAETFNVTLSGAVTATLGTPSSAVVTILEAGTAFSGTFTAGTGGGFPSLTNPGGIFEAINSGVVTGNITINIVSDLTGETGAVLLKEGLGGFSVLIKPSGAARTISGAAPAAGGLIGFNGSDNVTIDGSLSGGNDRSLTISPSNAAVTGGGIYFASGTAGAQNNTVRSVNVFGGGATAGILLGITFAGNTFGGVGTDNDNNRIINNDIRGAFYGIASLGASSANKNTGTIIAGNVMPGVAAAGIGRVGIYVLFDDGGQIVANSIASVANPGSVDSIGIAAGSQGVSTTSLAAGGVSNIVISRNYIGVITNNATFSSVGIAVASEASGTNRVDNNMITGVTGNANAGDIVAGIYVNPIAGATQNIYYNSVSMTGDRGSATADLFPSYALAISQDQPVNVVNNALVNSQTHTGAVGTGGESYAIGFDGPAANVNLTSNNNDLFVSGPIGQVGITGDFTTTVQTTTAGTGTNRTTLAAWQAATGEDAASVSVNPLFTTTTNLHLLPASPIQDLGVAIAGLPLDFDLQMRGVIVPPLSGQDDLGGVIPEGAGNTDIGADEILAPNSAGINVSGRVMDSDGQTGISRVRVTLTGGNLTQPMIARTNPFGYYSFSELQVGQTYILTVNSKRYTFMMPTMVITPDDNIQNADFTAFPQ